ncbi:MAG: ABC transporter permease [Planctomycetota bacterium]|nr:MAG: ABC transporter permease [Planctomycetota bacterium]
MNNNAQPRPVKTPWRQIYDRFRKNRLAILCIWVFLALGILSFLLPILSPYDYTQPQMQERMQPPSLSHWFGTDAIGIDMLTKSFAGLRVSILVGIFGSLLTLAIGLIYGAISGYAGGKVDQIMMRTVDVLYGLPYLAYVILIIFVFKDYGEQWFTAQEGFWARSNKYIWEIFLMTLALGSISWLTIARIVRAQVLSIKQLEYVEAARALGASNGRILLRHILPNLIGPVIVYITLTAPNLMLFESFISFLGLGIQPPTPSIGKIISDDALAQLTAQQLPWWLLLFPSLLLATALFCLNIIGDGLRDAFDVK